MPGGNMVKLALSALALFLIWKYILPRVGLG